MRKAFTLLFLFASFFVFNLLPAQHPTCDGIRYSNAVFQSVDSTANIKFGQNTTYGGVNLDLYMDIFEPAGDTVSQRPVIIWAYGGAFIFGSRSDVYGLCERYAQQGFVTVAFDYRLFDNGLFTDSSMAIDAVIKALHDMKAAIRYLREDAANGNPYRIDPNLIYAGGISAGAITAAHNTYLDSTDNISQVILDIINQNGGYEGNSNSINRPSDSQGYIGYSGALKDANWIDASDPPMYAAHDDGDQIVSYSNYQIQVGLGVRIYLEGSLTMKSRCDALGIPSTLLTIPNSNSHVSYFQSTSQATTVYNQTTDMLYQTTCPGVLSSEPGQISETRVFPIPARDQLNIVVADQYTTWQYQMLDASGRLVANREDITTQDVFLNLSEMRPGIYFLRIMDDAGHVEVRKIMLQ